MLGVKFGNPLALFFAVLLLLTLLFHYFLKLSFTAVIGYHRVCGVVNALFH
jgi:hypothetical protein